MLNPARPKRPRLHFDSEQYNQVRQEILRRDGWRCQLCGTRSNLEVHHQEFRSHGGDDSESNLITREHNWNFWHLFHTPSKLIGIRSVLAPRLDGFPVKFRYSRQGITAPRSFITDFLRAAHPN